MSSDVSISQPKPSGLILFGRWVMGVTRLGASLVLLGAVCALAAPIGWPFELFGSFPYTFAALALASGLAAGLARAPRLCALNILACLGLVITALVSVGSLPHAIKPSNDPKLLRIVWHNVMRENSAVTNLSEQVASFEPNIVALGEVRPGPDFKKVFPATGDLQGQINGAYFGVQQSGCQPLTLPPYQDKWWKGRVWGLKAQCEGFTLFAVHLRNPLWRWGERLKARNHELNLLETEIDKTAGPIVLIGDFNTVPSSFALRSFVEKSQMTRIACGGRWHPTWRPKPLVGTKGDPNFWFAAPIDHLMVRDIDVHSCSVGTNTGSDHFPLLIEIKPPTSNPTTANPPAEENVQP
jgi:hypothetical protein